MIRHRGGTQISLAPGHLVPRPHSIRLLTHNKLNEWKNSGNKHAIKLRNQLTQRFESQNADKLPRTEIKVKNKKRYRIKVRNSGKKKLQNFDEKQLRKMKTPKGKRLRKVKKNLAKFEP